MLRAVLLPPSFQALQKAFEAYRVRLARPPPPYIAAYGRPTFRRAVLRAQCLVPCREETSSGVRPMGAIARLEVVSEHRLADRIATRVSAKPVTRESPPTDMAGAASDSSIRSSPGATAWSFLAIRKRRLVRDRRRRVR